LLPRCLRGWDSHPSRLSWPRCRTRPRFGAATRHRV
jgi:hypothetical protein